MLVQQGLRDFKAIDRETDRILAAREVRATLRALEQAGSSVTYHQVDVRDHDASAAVVDSVYERHGRLDGVVAGAGIMNNVLLAEKTIDVFGDVYSTKVDSLRTLLQSVRGELGFLLVFSSAVGHTGNRGQIDYTAANDALDTITRANADRTGGCWSSTGTVGLFTRHGLRRAGQADGGRRHRPHLAGRGHRLRARRPGTDRREPAHDHPGRAPAHRRPRRRPDGGRGQRGGRGRRGGRRRPGHWPGLMTDPSSWPCLRRPAGLRAQLADLAGARRRRAVGGGRRRPGAPGDRRPRPAQGQAGRPPRGRRRPLGRPQRHLVQPVGPRAGGWHGRLPVPGVEPSFGAGGIDSAALAGTFGLPVPDVSEDTVAHRSAAIIRLGISYVLRRLGVRPDLVGGHSIGEWSATVSAGMSAPADAEALITSVDLGAVELPQVDFAAIVAGADEVVAALGGLAGVEVSTTTARASR